MEVKYPLILVVSILLFFLTLFLTKKKTPKDKNRNKNKIANTSIVKNTNEFKSIMKKYRVYLYLIYVLVFIVIAANALLSSRIVKVQSSKENIYNRDIILCMDISGSVDQLNSELVDSYKEIVNNLKGERFGISIFNTSSYLLVPLTDDYDYIQETLDTLSKALNQFTSYDDDLDFNESIYLLNYIMSGTMVGNEERGSSLVGDGLASCVFDFPNLDEKRSRIIVLSTDNDVQGDEYIDVEGAAKISKKKDITVYAIAPSSTVTRDGSRLKNAAELTGGEYYVHKKGPTVEKIVSEIEKKEKSLIEGPEKTTVTDYPTVPFIITLVGFIILIILDKVVLS